MTAGLVLDRAIVALLGVAVVVGLVALRVHALDHPQQRSDPPSRRSPWGAILPIALSALFQARLIGEAAPAVRGTTAACGVIAVVLLFVAAEVWNRDARRRIEGVPRRATPGRIAAGMDSARRASSRIRSSSTADSSGSPTRCDRAESVRVRRAGRARRPR